jgi:hypothetical protein
MNKHVVPAMFKRRGQRRISADAGSRSSPFTKPFRKSGGMPSERMWGWIEGIPAAMAGRSLHADDPLRRRDDFTDDRRFIDPRRMHFS